MLYENSDPFRLVEPGCVLDVEKATYESLDARRVRVSGSRYETKPYTMKLEGAGGGPFQTLMLVESRKYGHYVVQRAKIYHRWPAVHFRDPQHHLAGKYSHNQNFP